MLQAQQLKMVVLKLREVVILIRHFFGTKTTDKWTVGSETFVAGTFEGNATGLTTSAFTGLTADSSPADDDLVMVYDSSASAYKKVTTIKLCWLVSSGGLTGALDFTLADTTNR